MHPKGGRSGKTAHAVARAKSPLPGQPGKRPQRAWLEIGSAKDRERMFSSENDAGRAIEKKMKQLLDRPVDAGGDFVVAAYERRVRDLEVQKALLAEKIANYGKPLASFGETYRTAFYFLANLWKLWQSDRIEDRRAVLRLVFAEKLPYARNEGYRTAEISMPFKLIGEMTMLDSDMVPRRGLEPPRLAAHGPEPCASTNSATWAGAPPM